MTITRRRILAATAAAPLAAPWIAGTARAEAKKLKISHQFPGGTIDTGDFRDQLCRRFAAELDKKTNGALTAEIYPNSSLVKTVAQYSAIRRGALDMTLYPLNYAGGEVSEYNIGFMPGVVSSYEQGYAWKKAEIGKRLNALMAEKGAVLVTWLWQAGGVGQPRRQADPRARGRQGQEGARRQPRDGPDAEGRRRLGRVDAVERALCGDADRHDGRLHDDLDQLHLVPPRGDRQEPDDRPQEELLLRVRAAADVQVRSSTRCRRTSRRRSWTSAREMEKFALEKAKADDEAVAKVYEKRGIKAYDIDQAAGRQVEGGRRDTCWKEYADKSASNAEFLKLSQQVCGVRLLGLLNRAIVVLSAIALVLASCVLTYSVVLRYFTPEPTDWQDEFSVFLLIGVPSWPAAWVHSQRGHIGIEALASILPPQGQPRCACSSSTC